LEPDFLTQLEHAEFDYPDFPSQILSFCL